MKKIGVFVMFFSVSFCIFGQEDYAGLYGKEVQINGPGGYEYLAVGMTEHSYNMLKAAFSSRNRDLVEEDLIYNLNIIPIKNHTKAIVDDLDIYQGKAKVILLTALDKGSSGWIPIEWLKGNPSFIPFSGRNSKWSK